MPPGRVLLSRKQIAARVRVLGRAISRHYRGRRVCFLGVMNGALGFVIDNDPKAGLSVDFDGHVVSIPRDSPKAFNLQLAYATSIHKMQGSEFPCAIVVAHKAHSFMHHRNLLYTAVTRARKSVILLGDKWGIENCAGKQQVDKRNTFLSFLLNDLVGATGKAE